MKNKNALLITLLSLLISVAQSQSLSPEVVASAGQSDQGTNVQLDWTLGELAILTIQSNNQQLTQGFHQPFYKLTAVSELPEFIGTINVFPNPTSDRIEMNLSFEKSQKVSIQLSNTDGKLLWTKEVEGQQILENKNLEELPGGNYFLTFYVGENQSLQTHKIQKIN